MNMLSSVLRHLTKIGLLLLVVTFTACNALKRVDDNELLLTKNTVYADGEKVKGEEIQSFVRQKPNSSLLGYPLRLNLYNLAKPNPDSSYNAWLHKKPKRIERLTNFLSKKQLGRLGESFIVKGSSVFLKKIGETPAVIDTSKTRQSTELLRAYYMNKGYFNTKSSYTIDTLKRKQRAEINYNLSLGNPYKISTFATEIISPAIDSIYNLPKNKNKSLVKIGDQYNGNKFAQERKRLADIYLNSGVYNFQESSIKFDVERDTIDTEKNGTKVLLKIDNLKIRGERNQKAKYKVYRFDSINVYTDYFFGDDISKMNSIQYNNYNIYYKNKLRYKPKALVNAIFLEKDSLYRDKDRIDTYRRISNLNTFKYPNIDFDSLGNRLNTQIYLSPLKKYQFGAELAITHSNIQNIGVPFSASVISRNVFGGAETLNVSARGSIGLLKSSAAGDGDFVSEIGADINLTLPRLWLPFNTQKIVPYYMLPQTRMIIGTNFQKNIGLDKQNFNAILGYNWEQSSFKKSSLELLNIQFVRNVNPERFFNVYQNTYNRLDDIASDYEDDPALADLFETRGSSTEPRLKIPDGTTGFTDQVINQGLIPTNSNQYQVVRRIDERRERLTENNLIFSTNFSYTKDSRTDVNENSFHQYRIKIESAGNLLSAFSNVVDFNKDENEDLTVFGVPFSQYIKTDFDYIKHWSVAANGVLAMRGFLGMATPYGNSNSIPFTKSYFGGGSNDNRAWNAYDLGPGKTKSLNEFNEANFKLSANLEYRFPIAGNIKGALFADAGNIWNLWDNEENEDATFNGFESLKDIALGTGIGLRYDFTYFIFRLDVGFKTYNPELEQSKRWFTDFNFNKSTFNIGVNYPF